MLQQTYEDCKRLSVYRQKDCELGLSQGKRVLSVNLSKSIRLYTLLQHRCVHTQCAIDDDDNETSLYTITRHNTPHNITHTYTHVTPKKPSFLQLLSTALITVP